MLPVGPAAYYMPESGDDLWKISVLTVIVFLITGMRLRKKSVKGFGVGS